MRQFLGHCADGSLGAPRRPRFPLRIIYFVTNDDLSWLYRQDPSAEETKVLPEADLGRGSQGYPDPRRFQSGPTQLPQSQLQNPTSTGYPANAVTPRQTQPVVAQPPTQLRTKRRRHRRPILRTLLWLLLAWLIFLIATPVYAYYTVSTLPALSSELPDQPGTTVLLVGSDARDELSEEDRGRLGTGSIDGRRTDTMLLLHTSSTGGSAMLSLPRDSFVDIPGKGKNKLNAAYAFGGPELLVKTIETNTGIKIDGYVEIGMLGLVNMVDAVGGIQVCPERAWKDNDAHLDIPAGCQRLDGVTALSYARMRKADPRGDLGRMERQREVIGQIVKETLTPMTFINPVRYWRVNMAAASTLKRSESTGIGEVFSTGIGLLSGWSGSGLQLTVPVSDANARTSAGSSMIWDESAAPEVFDAIAHSDLAKLEHFR